MKSDLVALAGEVGIQSGYVDMAGVRREASAGSLLAMLGVMGFQLAGEEEAGEALRGWRAARLGRWLEPVQVHWLGGRWGVVVRLPAGLGCGVMRVRWECDGVGFWELEAKYGEDLGCGVAGLREVVLPRPAGLVAGYWRVVCEVGACVVSGLVIVAPGRAYCRRGRVREWGLFSPLYALHSDRSQGVGDYGDLGRFMEWVGRMGGGFVGTLPLLPAFLGDRCEPSPYSPVTRLGWNEVYLNLEAVPEVMACPAARGVMEGEGYRRELERLRGLGEVDYAAVMGLKRSVLEVASRWFFRRDGGRRVEFEGFMRGHPGVADYARFRAVQERRGVEWVRWPERMRGGELRAGDGALGVERYHAFVQWLASEQVGEVARKSRLAGVDLYLDMPLGTHRDGFDAWRQQGLFALGASGGCPPDPVFTQGQDWGFAPIDPVRSREEGHAYIRAYLSHHLRRAGMLRIDHVMGLHRLYWVPRGLSAAEGAYVTYPAEELYAILVVESHRHRAVVVGEDLGTVAPEVKRMMKRRGILGMYVAQYEFRGPPKGPLRRVPEGVVAGLNTHDMPPFEAWCRGLDLGDRLALGLLGEGDVRREKRLRGRIKSALRRFLSGTGVGRDALMERLLGYLAGGRAGYLLLNVEDLWREVLSQNVPGTSVERVNWRRRLRMSMEELEVDGGVGEILRMVGGRRCGRVRRPSKRKEHL